MSDQHDRLSDEAIELGLARRAPHGADSVLLESIVSTAAGTPQVRSWVPGALSPGAPNMRIAWIAIVLAVLVALAAFVVGGGVTPPSDLAVVVSPNPSLSLRSTTPSPKPSSSPEPCATEMLEVRTGDALPTISGDSMESLGLGRGVYFAGGPARLWAVGPGNGSATLIASVGSLPVINIYDVLDVSPDGSNAVIRVGHFSGAGLSPECADLYVVRTDGSGATRLTTFGEGRVPWAAAFSPDGQRVAFTWSDPGTITVVDLLGGRPVDQRCPNLGGFGGVPIAWSPAADKIAVDCNGTFTIFFASGRTAPIELPAGEATLAFRWTDDRSLLLARVPEGPGRGGMHIDSVDVITETSTLIANLDDADIEAVLPSAGGFSADGRWLAFQGFEPGDAPGDDFGYLVPTSGGAPTRILKPGVLPIAWSTDSRALIYVGRDENNVWPGNLTRLEVETLRRSTIGTIANYEQGVWRIP